MKRTVFFVSDRTGITVETLAHSLLTQFEGIDFDMIKTPFVDTPEKARLLAQRINRISEEGKPRPLVFSTLIEQETRECIEQSNALVLDMFEAYIRPLEKELGIHSSHAVGRSHSMGSNGGYKARIDAINFALANDDGITTSHYDEADIVLIGVSRSGKTPTCLYLALQFGILAANYPLTDEDLQSEQLPKALKPWRRKLHGLSISAERLCQIRNERRPNSQYSSLSQCEYEVGAVEAMYQRDNVPFINTGTMSIEEIATFIMNERGIERRWHGG